MALVDNANYVDGPRSADPSSLQETFELLRERNGTAWIGLYRPDVDDIRAVAPEFKLHKLAVDDAITAHERAKLERYKTTLFTVLRPARYLDDVERVEFGERTSSPAPISSSPSGGAPNRQISAGFGAG